MFRVAVDDDELEGLGDLGLEPLAEPGHVLHVVVHLQLGDPASLAEADDQRGRDCAGSNAALLKSLII